MKLPFYTDTSGLERFPQHKRFAVYRNPHKRLLREDADYRKRWNANVAGIALLVVTPITAISANGTTAVVLRIILPLVIVPLIVWLAFRHQKYMNQRIGEALQNHS